MNDDTQSIDDCELERLADGELGPAGLQTLFDRLDQSADGWKRAALVLLEAQTLRTACRETASRPAGPVSAFTLPTTAPVQQPAGRRELLSVAAALLVTCGLGLWMIPSDVENQSEPVGVVNAEQSEAPLSAEPVTAVQMTFAGYDGEWSEPVAVPVLDADDPRAAAWLTLRPTIPDAVRERLVSQGQRVREEQSWVPVELADGRVGVVPVTDVVVAPATSSDYQ